MIETIIFPKKNYTVQECFGTITTEELLDTARSFFGGMHTPHVIWDFSIAEMVNISPQTVQKLAITWSKQSPRRAGCKMAIIVPPELQYSYSTMFESMPELQKANFETKIVSSLGEAKEWFSE